MNPRENPTRPWVGIGVLAFRGEDVLLIRRGRPPRQGEWSLPGGAQRIGERAEDCARRELLEETGVEVGALELLAVVDSITPGEAGAGPRVHYTSIDDVARGEAGTPRAGGDVTEVAWCASADPAAFGLWPEAVRVIGLARRRLGFARP